MISIKDPHLLLERTRGDTSTPCTGLKVHVTGTGDAIPRETGRVSAWNVRAIARHAGGATVEERAALRIFRVVSPIVIGKGALVAALISQHLFERPGEVPVPS